MVLDIGIPQSYESKNSKSRNNVVVTSNTNYFVARDTRIRMGEVEKKIRAFFTPNKNFISTQIKR
jgi:hypothetical protein